MIRMLQTRLAVINLLEVRGHLLNFFFALNSVFLTSLSRLIVRHILWGLIFSGGGLTLYELRQTSGWNCSFIYVIWCLELQ